jgi:transcriptional regulator with PAS, ATPase and Fis domain
MGTPSDDVSGSKLEKPEDQYSLPETAPETPTTSLEAAKIPATERELIARVIEESRTLREAASRLGIAGTTLWRKRKLYGLASAAMRCAIEREHIARILAESPTLREAASRLGVAGTTLWRKRKLYRLGPVARSPGEKPR